MTHELLNKVRDAKNIAEVKQAIDSLYSIFTQQLDDEGIVELVDTDRYCELTDQIINLRRACDHAKSFLTEANAPVAIPMAQAMVVACLSTFAFTGALSPAALEKVKSRQDVNQRTAIARSHRQACKNKPFLDSVVVEARRKWLTAKPRPPSWNAFALSILDEVNAAIISAGGTAKRHSTIAKRLQSLDKQEELEKLRNSENLFG